MTALEILIIHLSIGAPFGVLEFFQGGRNPQFRTLARTFLATVFWPIILSVRLGRRVAARLAARKHDFDRPPERDLDILVASTAQTLNREARSVFEDYVSLSLAASQPPSDSFKGYEELLSLSGHGRPMTGAACLLRKRNAVLIKRLGRTRSDLLDTIASVKSDTGAADAITRVCDSLQDAEMSREIRLALRHAKETNTVARDELLVTS